VKRCLVCANESQSEACKLHEQAYANFIRRCSEWKRATGTSWQSYLARVSENPNTGLWARVLARRLAEVYAEPPNTAYLSA